MKFFIVYIALVLPILCTHQALGADFCHKLFAVTELKNSSDTSHISSATPTEIGKRIYAVHATRYLPQDGTVRGGNPNPSFRPAIHWNLGELVRPHTVKWEEYPIAVVAPLESLKSQLINLYPRDTITIGDFAIPNSGILILPEAMHLNFQPTFQIFRYDSTKMSLRQAVDTVIKREGGWAVDTSKGELFNAPAYVDGINISNPKFFKKFLGKLSREMTYMVEDEMPLAKIDDFLIRRLTLYMLHPKKNSEISMGTLNLEIHLRVFEYFVDVVQKTIETRQLSKEVMNSYIREKRILQKWFNFLKVDLQIRKTHGKTAFTSPELRDEIKDRFENFNELHQWYLDNLAQLKEVSKEDGSDVRSGAGHKIHPTEIARLASVLSPKDFEGLQQRIPDLIEQSGGMEIVRGFYALQRLRVLGFDKAQSEGDIKIINQVFQVRSEKEKLAMLRLMDHMLQSQFTKQYDRPSDRSRAFHIPAVKKFIEERYDFNAFIDGKIYLD